MRVDVTPRAADVVPGIPLAVAISITNTSEVIGGFQIRVLGADPSWVVLSDDFVSMFPEESRTVTATITVPNGIAAGVRRAAVQVREVTPPFATTVAEIDLTVPSARAVTARIDPVVVMGGRSAKFTVLVENLGNTLVRADLAAEDAEGGVRFKFEPAQLVALAPGEHAVVDMTTSAKQRLTGSPNPRVLSLYLDDVPEDAFFDFPDERPAPKHDEETVVAHGTFVQRPMLTRGVLSLIGLIAAITVFAIVITLAMSQLVGQSAADRNLALQIAAALQSNGSNSGTSGMSGTVRLLTSGQPVSGVSVGVYDASNTAIPVSTTATDSSGAYHITALAAGQYKLSFRGANFLQMWYPSAISATDASTVRLGTGQTRSGLDVTVGGVPATISGTVSGDNLSGATLYLEKSVQNGSAAGNSVVVPSAVPGTAPGIPPNTGAAIVKSVPIGSDGSFTLSGVPSPSVYLLVLAKPGYATSTQPIDVGAGEDRTSVSLVLRQGDGLISGTVASATAALSGVTITATTGTTSASTVSLSENPPGGFTLRNLPTPGTYTLIASTDGYASQTLTVTLAAGQKLTGVALTLGKSAGTLSGLASIVHPSPQADTPAAGVAVSVTDGLLTVQTETQSTSPVGKWDVGGLPIPGTYTVTFSRADLAPQTVSVSLDAQGHITPASQGTTVTAAGLEVRLEPATAVVFGTVRQVGGARVCDGANGLGEATVSLSSGTSSYRVTTASTPRGSCGDYRIENIPPGTYTLTVEAGAGTIPNSQVVQLAAGDQLKVPVTLGRPASMQGTVVGTNGTTPRCGWTVFLYLASDYPQTVTASTTTTGTSPDCNKYRFPIIDAGTYIIGVSPTSDPINTVLTLSVTIRQGEQFTKVIKADAGG
jgi:hypothetical protein